jgi:hypothetical protein
MDFYLFSYDAFMYAHMFLRKEEFQYKCYKHHLQRLLGDPKLENAIGNTDNGASIFLAQTCQLW